MPRDEFKNNFFVKQLTTKGQRQLGKHLPLRIGKCFCYLYPLTSEFSEQKWFVFLLLQTVIYLEGEKMSTTELQIIRNLDLLINKIKIYIRGGKKKDATLVRQLSLLGLL